MLFLHQELEIIAAACASRMFASSVPGTRPCSHHFQPPPERERERERFHSLPCCLTRSQDRKGHRFISVDALATQVHALAAREAGRAGNHHVQFP